MARCARRRIAANREPSNYQDSSAPRCAPWSSGAVRARLVAENLLDHGGEDWPSHAYHSGRVDPSARVAPRDHDGCPIVLAQVELGAVGRLGRLHGHAGQPNPAAKSRPGRQQHEPPITHQTDELCVWVHVAGPHLRLGHGFESLRRKGAFRCGRCTLALHCAGR